MGSGVDSVLGGQEHWPGREHHGRVIENPIVIKRDQVVDRLRHEGVSFFGEHEVIGNADGYRFWEDYWEYEERVEGSKTADVQIDVHASIVVKDEIPDGVGPLNGVRVGVECVKEPGIVFGNELSRTRVRPKHVLVVWHHFSAAVRNTFPSCGEGGCFPSLVQNAWNTFSFPVLGCVPP